MNRSQEVSIQRKMHRTGTRNSTSQGHPANSPGSVPSATPMRQNALNRKG